MKRRASDATPAAAFGGHSFQPTVAFARKGNAMLYYAVVFFVIALVAALFGFGGIAAGAVGIAKILFFVFLVVAIISAVLGLARRT
jgi:uncharacterized membrane protein YtjA (UPF0391 family)